MFRVTDVTVPPIDLASDETKKLTETLQRSLTDEQVAPVRRQARSRDRHQINQSALAQVTGAATATDPAQPAVALQSQRRLLGRAAEDAF